MRVVGLTGKFCSGKSTVAEALASRQGVCVIDVDALGHAALAVRRDEIRAVFGEGVCAADGSIDRAVLGCRVFSSDADRARLEFLVHPEMVRMCRWRLEELEHDPEVRCVVIDAALLTRMGLDRLCSVVVFVESSLPVRWFRALRTRGLTLRDLIRRERAQRDIRLENACGDYVLYGIMNDTSRDSLGLQIDEFLSIVLSAE